MNNRELGKMHKDNNTFSLRIWRRKERKLSKNRWLSERVTIKCGCCDEKLEIHPDHELRQIEIGGVNASVENWREILLPLLGTES